MATATIWREDALIVEFDFEAGECDFDEAIGDHYPDTDRDGLSDGTEVLTERAPAQGGYRGPVDVQPGRPGFQTNPLDPDSDDDGLNDGAEDTNGNGRFEPDRNETDPT